MHVSVKRYLDSFNGVHDKKHEEFQVENAFYTGGIFFVENTAIALITKDIYGNNALLLSADGLSPKITPYLPEIEAYSKISPANVYKIPQTRFKTHYNHSFDEPGIHDIYENRLQVIQKSMEKTERTVYKCKQYIKLYEQYEALRLKVFPKLVYELEWAVEADECENHIKEVDEKITKFMSEHPYKELVDIAFFNGKVEDNSIDENFRSLLRSAMNASGDLAFLKVFDDGNTYSPDLDANGNYRFVMNNEDSIALTENMLAGTLKHGQKFGNFTIMSKSHGYVKISCNKYSPEMLTIIHDDCLNYKKNKSKE